MAQPITEGEPGGSPMFHSATLPEPMWCPTRETGNIWTMQELPNRRLLVATCTKPGGDYLKAQKIYLGYWNLPGCTHELGTLRKPSEEGYVMLPEAQRPNTDYMTKCITKN